MTLGQNWFLNAIFGIDFLKICSRRKNFLCYEAHATCRNILDQQGRGEKLN
jgi:hypothetical protein